MTVYNLQDMHKTLKKLVEQYGQQKIAGCVFLVRPLSETVYYAQVWPELSPDEITPELVNPRIVYFVIQDKKPIGGVELLESNLDTFMMPAYRGKGLFSTAMRECIIPHILQQKPLQRVQIDRSQHAERRFDVLKKIFIAIGFTVLKDDGQLLMVVDASRRPAGRFIAGENQALSGKRKEIIMKEFLWFAYRLILIRSELVLQEGISYQSEDIGEMIKKMQQYGRRW